MALLARYKVELLFSLINFIGGSIITQQPPLPKFRY